jgi:APA family basic amino acid/polyamine antiporter
VGLNMVIGSGFFLFPSRVFRYVGVWGPLEVIAVGLAMIPIALCFGEVASRFTKSGGPYTYTRAAFGQFVGFQVAWLLWISRIVAQAAVLSGLLLLLATLTHRPVPSTLGLVLCAIVTIAVAAFSIAGGRQNLVFINSLTLLKGIPIVAFVVYGFFCVDWSNFAAARPVSLSGMSSAALLILYSFSGFELLTIPAGEAKTPATDIPQALLIALLCGIFVEAGAHAVVIGITGDPSSLNVALADAAGLLLGNWGEALLLVTAMIAIVGHNASSLLSVSRLLFAAAQNREIPRAFATLHPRFRTPWVAVTTSALCVLALTASNTFESLVVLAAGTRIVVYTSVVLATVVLRRKNRACDVPAAAYRAPCLRITATAALLTCAVLFLAIDTPRVVAIAIAAAAGAALFYAQRWRDSDETG